MQLEDLEVYKRLFRLELEIHRLTMKFPKHELYELGSQLRRSSNSVAANVAEVFGNKHTNVYLEEISRAQGEIREAKHHLRIAYKKGYITKKELDELVGEYEECSKMLYGLEKSLEKRRK